MWWVLPRNYHHGLKNEIKAFRKSLGTSLIGFEAEITRIFLALEARKKTKVQGECSQKKEAKTSSKGRRELNSLLNSWNLEEKSALSGSASEEQDSVVHQ